MQGEINPQIKTVKIGVRDLREIEILPISYGDQKKLSALIIAAAKEVIKTGATQDVDEQFMSAVLGILQENLEKIIPFITDEDDPQAILNNSTNNQLIEIGTIVYEENYKKLVALAKNLVGLILKMGLTEKTQSVLTKLQHTSSENIPSTE